METVVSLAAKPVAALRATHALLRPDADRLATHARAELAEFTTLLRSPEFATTVEGFANRKRD